jgi:hypothetical protein
MPDNPLIADDELVRSLVATVWGNDLPFQPIFTTGHVVGAMSATEAARFADMCVAVCSHSLPVDDLRRCPAA